MQADFSPGARTAGPAPCQLCPLTIEAWFGVDASGVVYFTLFEIPGYISINISTNTYEYILGDGGEGQMAVFGPNLEPGSWHHFAFVCSWRGVFWGVSVFFDGEHVGGAHGWTEVPQWTCDGPMTVATNYWVIDPFLPGAVDDIRISSQGLYSYGESFVPELHPTVRPDTVALWQFNEEDGGVVRDVSGHGYDMVLENGMLVADACHAR